MLVSLPPRARRPLALLALATAMLLLAGITAAVPMAAHSDGTAVGLEPGEPRQAFAEVEGRTAGPARVPSTTTSTSAAQPDAPAIGAARPDPVRPGARGTTSTSTSTTSTTRPRTTTTMSPPAPAWRATSPAPLGERSGHEAVATPGGVVVLGGTATGPLTGAVYDAAADEWTAVARPPAQFDEGDWRDAEFGAVWSGSRVFVAGRSGGVAAYDPADDAWQAIPLPSGVDRAGGVVAWTGTRLLVWGGDAGDVQRRVGLSHDPAGADAGAWQRLADAPFDVGEAADRQVHAVWTGSRLLVWDDSHRGWAYDPSRDEWSGQLAVAPVESALDGAAVVWAGSQALWFFGEHDDGGRPAVALAYDPGADEWETLPAPPVSGRHRAAPVVLADGRVFVCCGAVAGTGTRAAVFSPASKTWTTTAPHDALALHGAGATATRSASRVVVWGGTGSSARGLTWTP